MGMYDVFETDENLEVSGVWIDYGDFRVKIASAGQGNKDYVRYSEKKLKPVRQALNAGALGHERSQALMIDIYANTIVLDWQVMAENSEGEKSWTQGIEDKNGDILDFNKENVKNTLRVLPRLFNDLQEQAMSIANFRKSELEDEAKN